MQRALAVVVLVGCGGGIPAKDYLARLHDSLCARLTRCGLFPDAAACALDVTASPDPSFQAAIDAGRSVYDADKAEQCINELTNAPCDMTAQETRFTPAVCDGVLTGTGQMGDPCASSSECASNVCNVPSCGMSCCTGTCGPANPPAKLGEPCATRVCDRGLTCDNTKTCVALFAAGAPCNSGVDCAYGLGCTGMPMTCKALPPIGQPCVDGQCADFGATCIGGTCQHVGLAGAACSRNTDCSPFYPCDTTGGACKAYPTLGMACTTNCSDGSWCNVPSGMPTGTCDARQANGATCTYSGSCTSDFCDDTGHCAEATACI